MRILGLFFQQSYRFSRHVVMGLRMDVWGVVICLVSAFALLRREGTAWGGVLLALALGGLVLIVAAQWKGYILFRPDPTTQPTLPPTTLPPAIELSIQASGDFAVRDHIRYLAEHPTIYTTPRSREHTLMAHLRPGRLLLIGQTRPGDWGWWYQFFKPETIEQIEPGVVIHGWNPRLAIKVSYRFVDKKGQEKIVATVLSFDDEESRTLVCADLTQEMRERATTPWRSGAFRKTASFPGESDGGIASPAPSPHPSGQSAKSCSEF